MTDPNATRRGSRQATGNRSGAIGGGTLLLDSLSATAVAAYSTRKLRAAYAGSAIRVVRASDSTQQDVGFTGSDLNTTSLTTFCSGTTCTIVKWYDQTANANDITTLVGAGAGGPQVYSGGVLTFASSGKASLHYIDTTTKGLMTTAGSPNQAQPYTVAIVNKTTVNTGNSHMTDGNSGGATRALVGFVGAIGSTAYEMFAQNSVNTGGTSDANAHGFIATFDDAHTNSALYEDNTAIIAANNTTGTANFNQQNIACGDGEAHILDGDIPEFIVFTSAISSGDRGTIRTSWNTYWGTP